ncbi:MAG: hypothetical protein RSB02_08130 [Anaerovoracaceae bacterium]
MAAKKKELQKDHQPKLIRTPLADKFKILFRSAVNIIIAPMKKDVYIIIERMDNILINFTPKKLSIILKRII